jgi:hypothetical protein
LVARMAGEDAGCRMQGAGFGNHASLVPRILQTRHLFVLDLVLDFGVDRAAGQGSISNPSPLHPQS